MSLTLYIGPMFAGKSSAILGVIRRNTLIGRTTFCITNELDKRYAAEATIMSHDKESHPATAVKTLTPLLNSAEFYNADCIIIEEAQFFPDLRDFVLYAVEAYWKEVIVVGLDGDSDRRPFGQVLDLIPFADTIHKLTALCRQCGDGTPALFSYRKPTAASSAQVNVGAADQYEPLCRYHFLESHFTLDKEAHIQHAMRHPVAAEEELSRCMQRFGVTKGSEVFVEIVKRKGGNRSAWLPRAGPRA